MASLFQPRKRARELQLAHALRSVPLFAEVPAADLVAIWRRLSQVAAQADMVLFERGQAAEHFYVIQSGTLEVRLGLGPSGIILRRLGPGDSAGELALLTGQPRSADVLVVEDAVLWVLERDDFMAVLAESLPLLRAFNRSLCDLVRTLTLQLEATATALPDPSDLLGLGFGPYRVLTQIGGGGMAAVYSAVHSSTGTSVAIKVLPVAWGEATELRARLQREARALQRLAHPNIITVVEVGVVEAALGGGCYLAMEWLPNALDRVLRAQYPAPLPTKTALALAHGVAQGLAAVHAAGMVHRDVKPSNILLRADGTAVLTDFGLVKALDDLNGPRLTASNVIMGTADYLAPEQIAGLPVDGRADLYALGVVLYEMLAGFVPFAGRDPLDTLRAHVEEAPPPLPPSVSPRVAAIVERALQKQPAGRFTSAGAMADALEAALREE